ncbi:hypothetical protein BO78DRAFT_194402 [Aspergillus sclerotiicarbonarius CBS 121057]|uniref:Uncharacterized protein n=1 Tax=Aspergillus sclerotiicarbonarius (strain CBS 121057 / IBT 28362) TaxID=1448318 RepID=A0A319E051_ASPSB|nr:hypothetical protein BO78DRAFT_194402 [Aspergillus sclerotiicarbonarius CBS 121057]
MPAPLVRLVGYIYIVIYLSSAMDSRNSTQRNDSFAMQSTNNNLQFIRIIISLEHPLHQSIQLFLRVHPSLM